MNARVPYDPATRVGEVEADHRHVSIDEADDAANPKVGKGTPRRAPDVEPEDWTAVERTLAFLSRPFFR
jgi:hypothetical protein